MKHRLAVRLGILTAGWVICRLPIPCSAADPTDAQVRELREQNLRLQEEVREQRRLIEDLRGKIGEILKSEARRELEMETLKGKIEGAAADTGVMAKPLEGLRITGEAGLAFFHSGSDGQYPNSEFRVDEAKVFLEAPVWKNVYVFSELDLVIREANDEFFHLGEFYVDFENVSALWKQDRILNVRFGRFDIPFGEEYLTRDVIDNPLISHSLSDLWGIDEGLALYGEVKKFQYILAVQNGGHPTLNDFDSDKAITGRVSYDPTTWLHLSASAMRTGDLHAEDDEMSEIWFGGGFFRALGSSETTTTFKANVYELDTATRWKSGEFKAAAGHAQFDDNDSTADNRRKAFYYYLQGTQTLIERLYAAARFSQIVTDEGLPLVGQGDFGKYFFRSAPTKELWRLSLGLGYRFSQRLVLKVEYSLEQGELVDGTPRRNANLFGAEVGLSF